MPAEEEQCEKRDAVGGQRGVAPVRGAQAGFLPSPPDAGHMATSVICIARYVLPPVVYTTAACCNIYSIYNFGSLFAENWGLLPYPLLLITADLNDRSMVEWV